MSKICVEIELETDGGTFTVSKCGPEEHQMPGGEMMQGGEMGGQEGAGGGPEQEEAGGQTFTSLKDALMAAADILTSGGSTDMATKQAAFSSADERLTR